MGNNRNKSGNYWALAMSVLSVILSIKDVGRMVKDIRK